MVLDVLKFLKKSSVLISVYDIIQRKEAVLYKDGIKLKKILLFFKCPRNSYFF